MINNNEKIDMPIDTRELIDSDGNIKIEVNSKCIKKFIIQELQSKGN